jgi:hypothetical protein
VAISQLLERHNLHPVLFDVGASGAPRDTWELIARYSTFVGFDADRREIEERTGTGYRRSVIVNEAVTAEEDKEAVTFFLTRSPYCSSTLEPDLKAQADYAIAEYFEVERKIEASATTLDAVIARLCLERIDWLKVDSQGTDLRLFNSLRPDVRDRVLCVEMEPGLIAGYKGEDVFTDVHRDMVQQGFWLSEANVCGSTRMRRSSMRRLQQLLPGIDPDGVQRRCRPSPGWVEATYLRSIEQLSGRGAPVVDYVLLWAFAVMRRQWGFALDVAWACENVCGDGETSRAMSTPVVEWFTRSPDDVPLLRRMIGGVVPVPVKKWVKRQLA